MTLLVDADGEARTGWHGYDLLVDRTLAGGMASVERYAGGDDVTVAVPRLLLGGGGPLRFDFEWTAYLPAATTLADFYTHGIAPTGGSRSTTQGGDESPPLPEGSPERAEAVVASPSADG